MQEAGTRKKGGEVEMHGILFFSLFEKKERERRERERREQVWQKNEKKESFSTPIEQSRKRKVGSPHLGCPHSFVEEQVRKGNQLVCLVGGQRTDGDGIEVIKQDVGARGGVKEHRDVVARVQGAPVEVHGGAELPHPSFAIAARWGLFLHQVLMV